MSANPAFKHGHTQKGKPPSPTYVSWQKMLARCLNPNHQKYALYGGQGVTVCERWKDFQTFLADMGERPEGNTLGRLGDVGNYEPDNCSWMTRSEQEIERLKKRSLKELIEHDQDCFHQPDYQNLA